MKLRIKVYKTVIRPVLLYGAETWALKKEERLLMRTEMRMLRWIMGISLREKKTNKSIKEMAGVIWIEEKAREERLRWFGHVKRRVGEEPSRRAMEVNVPGRRKRGRQAKRWMDCVKEDVKHCGMKEEWALDRLMWRKAARWDGGDPS